MLNVKTLCQRGEFPFHPFGDDYDYDDANPEHLKKILSLVTAEYIQAFIIGTPIFQANVCIANDISLTVLKVADAKDIKEISKMTKYRAMLLNLTSKIFRTNIGHYVSIVKKIDTLNKHTYCTVCNAQFTGTFAEHLKKCLPLFDNIMENCICASCSESLSQEYTDEAHMCSQQHYNSHFQCLVLTELGKVSNQMSTQAYAVLSPNFRSIIQLMLKKQYYTTQNVSNNWITYMNKYAHNIHKQTFDLDITIKTIIETFDEFGCCDLPCSNCNDSLSRVSGVNLNDFITRLYARRKQNLSEAFCRCGNTTIVVDKNLKIYYNSLGEEPQIARIVSKNIAKQAEVKKSNRDNKNIVAASLKDLSRYLTQKKIFQDGAQTTTDEFDTILNSLDQLAPIPLNSVISTVMCGVDFEILLYNKCNSQNTDKIRTFVSRCCETNPVFAELVEKRLATHLNTASANQNISASDSLATSNKEKQPTKDIIANRRYHLMVKNSTITVGDDDLANMQVDESPLVNEKILSTVKKKK